MSYDMFGLGNLMNQFSLGQGLPTVGQRAGQVNPLFQQMQGNLLNRFDGGMMSPVQQMMMGIPNHGIGQAPNQFQQQFRQLMPSIGMGNFPTMQSPYNPRDSRPGGLMGPSPAVEPDLTNFNALFDDRIRSIIPENAMIGYAGE